MNGSSDDIEMNNGNQNFDSCGFEPYSGPSLDTRNVKWKAKQNHTSTAASSKSFNFLQQGKYLKRRQEKIEREEKK